MGQWDGWHNRLFDFSIRTMLFTAHFYVLYSKLKRPDPSNRLPKTLVSQDLVIKTGFLVLEVGDQAQTMAAEVA